MLLCLYLSDKVEADLRDKVSCLDANAVYSNLPSLEVVCQAEVIEIAMGIIL